MNDSNFSAAQKAMKAAFHAAKQPLTDGRFWPGPLFRAAPRQLTFALALTEV